MDAIFQGLTTDLLANQTRPRTLESMLAVHTAAHGPYIEVGGVVTGVAVDSLPDRLWDLHHPLYVLGSLSPSSLCAHPAQPALVRLQVAPVWLAHDLFVWAAPPPAPPGSSRQAAATAAPPSGAPAAVTVPASPGAAPPGAPGGKIGVPTKPGAGQPF